MVSGDPRIVLSRIHFHVLLLSIRGRPPNTVHTSLYACSICIWTQIDSSLFFWSCRAINIIRNTWEPVILAFPWNVCGCSLLRKNAWKCHIHIGGATALYARHHILVEVMLGKCIAWIPQAKYASSKRWDDWSVIFVYDRRHDIGIIRVFTSETLQRPFRGSPAIQLGSCTRYLLIQFQAYWQYPSPSTTTLLGLPKCTSIVRTLWWGFCNGTRRIS